MKIEKQNRQAYPSELTDTQWEVIEHLYSNMRVCTNILSNGIRNSVFARL